MVEMLLRLMDGASPAGMREVWPARLIARSSDGPAQKIANANTRKIERDQGSARDDTKATGP
jgi:hypothetical protein